MGSRPFPRQELTINRDRGRQRAKIKSLYLRSWRESRQLNQKMHRGIKNQSQIIDKYNVWKDLHITTVFSINIGIIKNLRL